MRRLRRLTYVIWMLSALSIALGLLVGCSTINTTVENGVGQVPGQRVHVTTTVYRW
jgi:xanthine/uracil/vitamin C permease (AzgA family)